MAIRLPILLLAAAILATGLGLLLHAPASAQEIERRPWSLRDLLFPRRSERVEPLDRFPQAPVKKKKVVRKPPEPKIPVVEKAPDARTVMVVGDFLASGLAEGLDAAFAESTNVRVLDLSKGSSGFVRDDVFDWPGQIKTLIEEQKPSAVIVMMGSNDRQQMKVGDAREQPRTPNWTREYESRTGTLGKAITAGKVPLLWVGLPAFKTSKMTSDMLAFNDIYRSAAEAAGGEFVDIWDGFVDENGAFVSTGPDINGQPVRLRADDGINFTRAGKRKIAFYVEKPLLKALGLGDPSAPGAIAVSVPAGPPAIGESGEIVPAAVDRTPPMLLNDPALDGGTELMGATPAAQPSIPLIPGQQVSEPAPGRADNFAWPPKQEPATTASTARP